MLHLAGAVALSLLLTKPATAQNFNWKSQDGQTINLMFNNHPWSQARRDRMKDFIEKTGIKTRMEIFNEEQFCARLTTPDKAMTGRYRVVIEASGKDASRQLSLEAVGPEGAIVQIGESEAWNLTETRAIRLKDFFLIRSFYFPQHEYAANVDILRQHRAQFSRLIDDRVALDGLADLFAQFARGERLKPVLALA